MEFGVSLNVYSGPLDLLLYLVRKHELDVIDIPILAVTEQFLAHLEVLEQINVNAVGDFVDMASTLIEIKSRMVLPRCDEVEDQVEDPREELVQRLLAYKEYRDAASMLDERGREWQQRFARAADDLPPRQIDVAEQAIQEVELWDLVTAVARVLRDSPAARETSIVYDDTPIHVFMERIYQRLQSAQSLDFADLFTGIVHKTTIISVFLAVLELVRHGHVRAEQTRDFGRIEIFRGPNDQPLNLSLADTYDHPAAH